MSFMFQGKNNHTKRIDDFIRYTLTNCNRRSGKMELIDSKIWNLLLKEDLVKSIKPLGIIKNKNSMTVVMELQLALKKLNNSKNIKSKELNEIQYIYKIIDYKRNNF